VNARIRKALSWLLGVAGVVLIAWYFKPTGILDPLVAVGFMGTFAWSALTIAARIFFARTTVEPMRALGYTFSLSDAFWIGWLRTFANQIVPLSGVAAYAATLRSKTAISWSELAALATPQYVLAAGAFGVVGFAAVVFGHALLGDVALWLAAIYLAVIVFAVAVAKGAAPLMETLPGALSNRAASVSVALRKFASRPGLIGRLIIYHAFVILLRGGRLWILFAAAGIDLGLQQLLLILAIAESSALLHFTPGGLGIREAAVLGGAALVGISPDIAAGVALIDRLFMIVITAIFAVPAVLILGSHKPTQS